MTPDPSVQPASGRHLGPKHLLFAALGSAPLGIWVTILRHELPLRVAVITQALLWFLTTAVAFYCIRHRNFEQHRQWMIRSYAITLIFLTDRVLDAIPKLTDLDTDASPNIVWFCNIIAWVVPSFIIAWPNLLRSARWNDVSLEAQGDLMAKQAR